MPSGGGASSNDAVIAEQRRQAAEQERKEAERQARLKYGQAMVNAIYSPEGGTVEGPDGAARTFTGIGPDFYDNYKNSYLGYYEPQLADRYTEAKSSLAYDLARRGGLRSSTAIDQQKKLLKEKEAAKAGVVSDADTAAADLRRQMAAAKANNLQLLYQTEDPTVAANQALTEVNAIESRKPNLDPLGDIFSAAAKGLQSYQNARNYQRVADRYRSTFDNFGKGTGRNYG